MILLPKHKDLYLDPPKPMFRGLYKLTVRDARTGKVTRETPWFENLITNSGLDAIYTTPAIGSGVNYIFNACYVGTGNTAPAYTDTTLTTYLAGTNYSSGASPMSSWIYVAAAGSVPPYWTSTGTWTFGVGVATGTLAEVGIGWGTPPSSYTLFSHALIVDGSGNPTTITVLASEQLEVSYTLQLYWNTVAQPGSLAFGGVTYTLSWLPSNLPLPIGAPTGGINPARTGLPYPSVLNAYNGSIGTPLTLPSGTTTYINFQSAGGASFAAYTIGNYYNDCTMTVPIGYLNLPGGITVLEFETPFHQFQIGFSPAIPKTSSYSFTFINRFAWARYP